MNGLQNAGEVSGVPWHRWLAWLVSLLVLLALGLVRLATGAEFEFAFLGLLPVLLMAWVAGRTSGLIVAVLATATWVVGDMFSQRVYSASWIPWANGITRFATYAIVVALVDQARSVLTHTEERSIKDPLTGLINRRALLEFGAREVDRSRRSGRPMAVVFIDLDNFKLLNDHFGHAHGDAALCTTSHALRAATRAGDVVARWGGDEFVLLLPDVDRVRATQASHRLSTALRSALQAFPGVTASVGMAWFEAADRPFDVMLQSADAVMYVAKQSGKDAVRVMAFPRHCRSSREDG